MKNVLQRSIVIYGASDIVKLGINWSHQQSLNIQQVTYWYSWAVLLSRSRWLDTA